ncbi:nitroreductase [Roridomyces roridus]|uniref:Nitroreductase n=1 Tax=Roridomyces roridus TaxID=1738132 RepID=A0AAD7FYS4_9AGAR|nr:nitroreductase [Roridomyces roridus]
MSKSVAFLAAIATRRSNYAITNKCSVPEETLETIVKDAVKHTPTSFNHQASRAVLVTGAANTKLWSLVSGSVLQGLEGDSKARNEARLAGLSGGYGSVIFFEDQAVLDAMSQKIPDYAKLFPIWSTNSTGMLQSNIWTAFTLEGLGASLQHYNQVSSEVDVGIREAFGLPASWVSTAIMPFGDPAAQPGDKAFGPIEERVRVFRE